MAKFRIGQRVRLIWQSETSSLRWGQMVGAEGTITALVGSSNVPNSDCTVHFDRSPHTWFCSSTNLSPLTDPGADAFLERIKKLGNEPINTVEKVKS